MEGITQRHRYTRNQPYFYNSLMQELTAPTNQRDKLKEQIIFWSI
jgi:hypothetical protein